jgi:hypothetical protein
MRCNIASICALTNESPGSFSNYLVRYRTVNHRAERDYRACQSSAKTVRWCRKDGYCFNLLEKNMGTNLTHIKFGLALVLLGLLFGISLGIAFGANEAYFANYVAQGIAAHPGLHDTSSPEKIWRYAQRAHFHATGIAAFSIGLVLLVAASTLKRQLKTIAAGLIGLGGLYPLAWLSIFVLAPSIGRDAAHTHWVTELLTYVGTGGLLLGIVLLLANIFLGLFSETHELRGASGA